MRKLQIVGTSFTRRTDRNYTHAVYITDRDGNPLHVVGYASSFQLAEKTRQGYLNEVAKGWRNEFKAEERQIRIGITQEVPHR